ncbi:hypothetical protein ACOSP7_024678 [Xanthoceras sorbifolium]
MTLAEAKERIGRLEEIVGEPPSRDVLDLSVMSIEHGEQILYLQQTVADIIKDVEVRINNVRLEQAGVVDMMTVVYCHTATFCLEIFRTVLALNHRV